MKWQQLKLSITAQQSAQIHEYLENAGALAITLTDAADTPIYEPEPDTTPLWQQTQLTALFAEDFLLAPLINTLQQQFDTASLNCQVELLADQAWERVCMDRFQPVCFHDRLWICPSWHHVAAPTAAVVKLDPGLAFGTGSHPTTRLCLDWLATQDLTNKTLIDYGCGSGILAIAALKLGAANVYAIDIDPQALEATKNNALQNDLLSDKLAILFPAALPALKVDIVIANILANPLVTLATTFTHHLGDCGKLVLSGILSQQIETVRAAYEPAIQFSAPSIDEDWVRLVGSKQRCRVTIQQGTKLHESGQI